MERRDIETADVFEAALLCVQCEQVGGWWAAYVYGWGGVKKSAVFGKE